MLLVHNRYTEPGGEDQVSEAEKALLEQVEKHWRHIWQAAV